MMNSRISARIDANLKHSVTNVFDKLGISEAEAIRMFYAQVDLHQGMPFDIKIPNKETIKAMQESNDLSKMTQYKSSKELFDDLDM